MSLAHELPSLSKLGSEVLNHQPISLADYLLSHQARVHAKELLARWVDGITRCSISADMVIWHASLEVAWTRIELVSDPNWRPKAYFHADGTDGYIVTDLGEGVRALRLQTGRPLDGARNWENGFVDSTAGVIRLSASERADLPEAICRVLLFSYQVAVGHNREKGGL